MGGGNTKYKIEWRIEQFEDGWQELQPDISSAILQNPQAAESFAQGATVARKHCNPVVELLRYFGYKTFEYTHGKDAVEASTPTHPTSVLLGNMAAGPNEEYLPDASTLSMYS